MAAAARAFVVALLFGCASSPGPASAVALERDGDERLGSHWDSMSPAQRECHLDAERAGRPAQYGDGTCESLR